MTYEKQSWENLPNKTTSIDSERLNHIEDGIYRNSLNIEGLKISYQSVTDLNIQGGESNKLSLPSKTIFVEPLVKSSGYEYSGGQFLTPGEEYTYLTNNDTEGQYRGMWVNCSAEGLVTVSTYKHCSAIVKGFRICYLSSN